MIAAPADCLVFIVEGEKDANQLAGLALVATCNPGGVGKWLASYAVFFRGRDVVILSDNDDAGRNHARSVATNLKPSAARVRILELPGLPPKGDVSDWLAAGGTREELLDLAAEAPAFSAMVEDGATPPEFSDDALAWQFTESTRPICAISPPWGDGTSGLARIGAPTIPCRPSTSLAPSAAAPVHWFRRTKNDSSSSSPAPRPLPPSSGSPALIAGMQPLPISGISTHGSLTQ